MTMKLEDVKKLLADATPGPWSYHNDNALNEWLVYPPEKRLLGNGLGPDEPQLYALESTEANARLIAAIPEIIARLVEEVELLRRIYAVLKVVATRYSFSLENAIEKYEKAGFE